MSAAGFLSSSGMDAVSATMQYGMNARKHYVDDDEDAGLENVDDDEQQPRSSRSTADKDKQDRSESSKKTSDESDGDDPLDAFMAGIEVQAKKDKETSEKHAAEPVSKHPQKTGRTDIDEEDSQESYFKWVEEQEKLAALRRNQADDDELDIDYDEEGNPIKVKKYIDPLPHLDHEKVAYQPFNRNFYEEHGDIQKLNDDQVNDLRDSLGVSVSGPYPPKPVSSFAHLGLDEGLMNCMRKLEYSQPTPIQAQAVPAGLLGRDVIGIAKTGSGKTAAYLWPAVMHIMDQPEVKAGEGPIALICVPTRELAIQVYNEAKRFSRPYGIRVICAYGGGSKWEQSKDLQSGAEIVVCTPGRIIDHVKIGATNFTRVTYLVFDEADRMFDLGFEPQVRSMADHVRPDRQCLMFSATFRKKIERLARDVLTDPVKIVQGEIGQANLDIEQEVVVLPASADKWPWLQQRLVGLVTRGKVLIFATRIQGACDLANKLQGHDHKVGLIHGELLQTDRNDVISAFRHSLNILVATDVAARGLDIPEIKTVVNYDVARDPDTHVHRIGRTGRAGHKGVAYTLITEQDKEFAGHLVRNLESVGQRVSPELMTIALKASWFRKGRFKQGRAKKPNIGGRGLGYVESEDKSMSSSSRPALPSSTSARQVPASGAGRLEAMRSAFSSSYKNKFHAASTETSWDAHKFPITDPTPEWKKRAIEQAAEQAPIQATDKRKKSRWD